MSKFFINRPIVAMVISLLMVIIGAVTIAQLPIAQFPAIAPPEVQIRATYVGADAQTIEQAVATPIEQQMSGVDNLNYMYSLNAAGNGQMTMIVNYDVKSDPNTDLMLTQMRQTQAASQLPQDVTNFGVTVQKSVTAPLMVMGLFSPNGTYYGKFLANYSYINLNDQLTRVPGIGNVQVFGAGQYAMRLWVKPDQLSEAWNHGERNRDGDSGAEHRESGRPGGGLAVAEGSGVHILCARSGPSDIARRIRQHRGPRNARRRNRPGTRRRANRAWIAGLHVIRPHQWQAGRDHRRLPIARFERRRCSQGRPQVDGRG